MCSSVTLPVCIEAQQVVLRHALGEHAVGAQRAAGDKGRGGGCSRQEIAPCDHAVRPSLQVRSLIVGTHSPVAGIAKLPAVSSRYL